MQVAVVWTKELNAPLLVVANDAAAQNEVTQMALKMAVPNGMKLLIRSVDDSIRAFQVPREKDKRFLLLWAMWLMLIKLPKIVLM